MLEAKNYRVIYSTDDHETAARWCGPDDTFNMRGVRRDLCRLGKTSECTDGRYVLRDISYAEDVDLFFARKNVQDRKLSEEVQFLRDEGIALRWL